MRKLATLSFCLLGLAALVIGAMPNATRAASHREAPLISLDPTADITDFFMFRSYEPGHQDSIVFVMDVIPGEEPSSGPNYWNFDPNVRYTISIDNDANGSAEDINFDFRFRTEIRGVNNSLGLPLSYVALPPITKLDGSGSEGLGLRQRYSVRMRTRTESKLLAGSLIAVPSNVGPRTMPNYNDLTQQGVYDLGGGIRVYAGQRNDPFYIDLGGVFDTLNLRRKPVPLLTVAEDANDNANAFGVDMLRRFSVHTIAIEVPASMLTKDGLGPGETAQPVLGAYASTSRMEVRVLSPHEPASYFGKWVQVQRLANPLVNEVIIGTKDKDRWNALEPDSEALFEDYYLNPRLATALEIVYKVPADKTDRTDLRDLLLKYQPTDTTLSELLRLNINVSPRPLADQRRLGPLARDADNNPAPDPAAWPNGRRPKDDVTDVAVRVVGGENYITNRAGDGINFDQDAALPSAFPFLANPADGRNRIVTTFRPGTPRLPSSEERAE